jgi:hypothetical protein
VASDRTKASYDCQANPTGFQERDHIWLYYLTQIRERTLKLQPSWKGPYKMIDQINDAVYRIQRHPTVKVMVMHVDRLVLYLGLLRVRSLKEGAVSLEVNDQ